MGKHNQSQIKTKSSRSYFSIYLFIFTLSLLFPQKAPAQIIPDQTLPVNSQVTPGCTICQIRGGTVRGVNLFHSFQQFSLTVGEQALFNNGTEIQNIFTRVTGNAISNIDGLIRTNGNANLFLLNPNGIIFGPNVQLNINGSFIATTASSFKFNNGSEFSTVNPQALPLLTVNINPGLQYGQSYVGATIVNRGNLVAGQDLTLIADKLDLQGQLQAGRNLILQAQNNLQIRDTNSAFIADSVGDITIQGNQNIDILALNQPQSKIQSNGNLYLISDGEISGDTHFLSGGNFSILTMKGQPGNFISKFDPIIDANGDVKFGNYTGVSLKIEATGSIQGGDIHITGADTTIPTTDPDFVTLTSTPSVILRAGVGAISSTNIPQSLGNTTFTLAATSSPIGNINVGNIDTSISSGSGNSGYITLSAQNNITTLSLNAYNNGSGNGGNITLNSIGGSINTSSGSVNSYSNSGNAGMIYLNANNQINVNNIDAHTVTGNAGNISLSSNNSGIQITGNLYASPKLFEGGVNFINASNGGTITLTAKDNITITNSRIFADGGNLGVSGNIFINSDTGLISVSGGDIRTDNYGKITGGNIQVTATDGSVYISNSAQLDTRAYAVGAAGSVTIFAHDLVSVDGTSSNGLSSAIASGVDEIAMGQGGGIDITTDSLSVTHGAQLTASTSGQGNAGNVTIRARNDISLDGVNSYGLPSGIFANVDSHATGQGGNINISTNSLSLTNGAGVDANTNGIGNAGNVTIFASNNISLSGMASSSSSTSFSNIAAQASQKQTAGSISITANNLNVINGAAISVSSPAGQAGNLTILANNLSLNQGELTAKTGAGNSGNNANIKLYLQDLLLMRNQSLISAQAFNTAQGGNINIDARNGFVVAVPSENSDINANASRGNGGKINITTQGIFGTQYRLVNTNQSDITATSQFGLNGEVMINRLNVDPIQGLQIFPTTVLDTSNQIAQRCFAGGKLANHQNRFTVTGIGGLPSSPDDLFTGTTTLINLVEPVLVPGGRSHVKPVSTSDIPVNEIVEVNGWIVDTHGQVHLIANTANTLSLHPVLSENFCTTNGL